MPWNSCRLKFTDSMNETDIYIHRIDWYKSTTVRVNQCTYAYVHATDGQTHTSARTHASTDMCPFHSHSLCVSRLHTFEFDNPLMRACTAVLVSITHSMDFTQCHTEKRSRKRLLLIGDIANDTNEIHKIFRIEIRIFEYHTQFCDAWSIARRYDAIHLPEIGSISMDRLAGKSLWCRAPPPFPVYCWLRRRSSIAYFWLRYSNSSFCNECMVCIC